MPGIVGVMSQIGADACGSLVRSMISSMEYETFYVSGTHFVPEMGVYAGWVALGGSFAAQQVFTNERKDIALVFAGECFHDSEWQTLGQRNGNSRNEKEGTWLIHLYEELGDQFFEKLNGLFSGLLIDKRRKRAFLFNDRYGLERLYVCETKSGLYFASEAKALLRVLPELRIFDDTGVAQFLAFGCTLDWQTLFRGVQILPGGSLWLVEGGNTLKRRYFCPSSWERQEMCSTEEFEARFDEALKRAVRRHFVARERVGISLTGGLDTRMIMACRPEISPKPTCYTFSGEKVQTLDARLAKRVAATSGLEHQLLDIGPDFFSKFASYVERTIYATDGCLGVLGAHEIYFNERARQLAPLRLTGVFGSEVLRGMSTFKPTGISPDLLNPEFSRSAKLLGADLRRPEEHPITFAVFREIPWNIFGSIAACRSQVTFRTPYLDNELVALAYQSPVMQTSANAALGFIERNAPVLGRIPTDRARTGSRSGFHSLVLRAYAEATFKLDYLYSQGMPDRLSSLDPLLDHLNSDLRLIGRHKFLHYRRWFRNRLARYVKDALGETSIRNSPYLNSRFVNRMASDHIIGRKNYIREINAALTLQAIENLLLRTPAKN